MREKIKSYLKNWKNKGYPKGIPDDVPSILRELNKAPSYKAIVVAILKNDPSLKSLGFSAKVSRYYSVYKKIELEERKSIENL